MIIVPVAAVRVVVLMTVIVLGTRGRANVKRAFSKESRERKDETDSMAAVLDKDVVMIPPLLVHLRSSMVMAVRMLVVVIMSVSIPSVMDVDLVVVPAVSSSCRTGFDRLCVLGRILLGRWVLSRRLDIDRLRLRSRIRCRSRRWVGCLGRGGSRDAVLRVLRRGRKRHRGRRAD